MSFDPDAFLAATQPAPQFDPDEFLKTTEPKTDFDPDEFLATYPKPEQSFGQNLANAATKSAHEGWTAPIEGAARMFGQFPELIGGAVEGVEKLRQTAGVDKDMSPEQKWAKLNTIRRNTATAHHDLAADSTPGALLAGAMDAAKADADKMAARRERVNAANPTDKEFDESAVGMLANGIPQVAAQIPMFMTGLGLPASATQMFDEGYKRAKAAGVDDANAMLAGVSTMPAASVDFLADKLALGPVLDLAKKGKIPATDLAQKIVEKIGASSKITKLATKIATGAAVEGATEAAQEVYGNAVAKAQYAPDQSLTENVGNAFVGGALTGGAVRGVSEGIAALDTRKNVPESRKTLEAQQQQLIEGRRPAQMFPKTENGPSSELPLPEGFARFENDRGVFHYDPKKLTEAQIQDLSSRGQENLILGLGPISKPETERRVDAGEAPIAITERTPEGTEVKTAVAPSGDAETVAAALEASKTPGNKIAAEAPGTIPTERAGNFVDALLKKDQAQKEQVEAERRAEIARREEVAAEAKAKRDAFDARIRNATQVFKNPNATFAQVEGTYNGIKFYAEDDSIGLNQEQRDLARRAEAALAKRREEMKLIEDARRDQEDRARRALLEQKDAEREAAAKAQAAAWKTQNQAGIGPDGKLDHTRLTEAHLQKLAETGDGKAERELVRRAEMPPDDRLSLLEALKDAPLPYHDAALNDEVKSVLFEEMNLGQRKRLASTRSRGLDYVAEQLRGLGFSQIQTPADVIEYTTRALRGEDVRAERLGDQEQASFAAAAARRDPLSTGITQQILDKPIEPVMVSETGWEVSNKANRERLFAESVPQSIPNADLGREIVVNRDSLKHSAGKANGPLGHAILGIAKQLVGKSVLVSTEPAVGAGRTHSIKRLIAAVRIRDRVIPVRLTVNGSPDGTLHLYDVQPLGHKKSLTETPIVLRGRPQGSNQAAYKVGDLLHNVKPAGDGTFTAEFANGQAQTQKSAIDTNREFAALTSAFPGLAKAFRMVIGSIPQELRALGYKGEIPATAEAVVVNARRLIVIAADAYTNRAKGAALFTHEIAHLYWDSLPETTRDQLRVLHAHELETKTGPLFKDGKLQTELMHVDALDERGHQEWFAERVARLNEDWARNQIDKADSTLLQRIVAHLREIIRNVWDSIARATGRAQGESLFDAEFKNFVLSGADREIGAIAGAAYAKANFATSRNLQAELETTQKAIDALKDSQEPAEEIEQRGRELAAKRAEIQKAIETQRQENAAILGEEEVAHPAAVAKPQPGAAWASVNRMTPEDMKREIENITQYSSDNYNNLSEIERANLRARQAALQNELQRSENPQTILPVSVPKPDRKRALIEQWTRGKAMRDEAQKIGSDTAELQGQRMVTLARQNLDEEFPGWDETPPARQASPDLNHSEPAQPADLEKSPFVSNEEPEPIRGDKMGEIYGNSSTDPSALEKTWSRVRSILVGIKGPIPELPTFPAAAWNKTDQFIAKYGPSFYNGLRQFLGALKNGNDYIQYTAQEELAKITKPLLDAETKLDATAYKKLSNLQLQMRRMKADGRQIPPALRASIAALHAKVEESPYVIFNRIILALDLNWRHTNLKDDQGNPIRLPASINGAELKAEIARLGAVIAASPHKTEIEKAVIGHTQLVAKVAEDLRARELLASDHLSNPYYFPHLTLEVTQGGKTKERELRPEKVRPGTEADFRGYLMAPVGSAKAVESDYVRAMYYHLVQVGAHNLKADAIKNHAKKYDVMDQVRNRAKQLTKERGRPVSWQQAFNEEFADQGYVRYGADSRDAFPSLTINRERLSQRLGHMLTSADLQSQLRELGVKGIKILPEDMEEAISGTNKEIWIVPARVAEALRGIADRESRQDNALEAAAKWTVGKWKAWKLFMPQSHFRYEYGNIVADLEKIFSASPITFKYLPESAREIHAFWIGGSPSDDLRAALKEGVINTVTAQEMDQLKRSKAFQAFETKAERVWREVKTRGSSVLYQIPANFMGLGNLSAPELSAMREAITRYAKFKADLAAIRADRRPDYGGAYWKDVDGIRESAPGAGDEQIRKAAAISKATFGDYGDLSVLGQTLRDKLIGFYSWIEVNFKYHANLLRNNRDLLRGGEISGPEAIGRTARAAGAFAAGRGAKIVGSFALRLALPYFIAALWNNSEKKELEELLSEEDRRRFHIILGEAEHGNSTLKDGRRILVVYGNTALADVIKWISGPAFLQNAGAWMNGHISFTEAMHSWASRLGPDFANNSLGSITPLIKIPYTYFSKRNPFPDVLDQRSIPAYDMRRVILGQMTDDFTADMIERIVNSDYYPSKGLGDWANQLIFQVRQRDPEQWAYYSIRDKASEFATERTGRTPPDGGETDDKQMVRNFRRAINLGDIKSASKFYLRLLEMGYTAERLTATIRTLDPLHSVPLKDGLRAAFLLSLSEEERKQLQRAYAYYRRIEALRGYERMLFPSNRMGRPGLDQFQDNPQLDRLETIMERSGEMTDDEQLIRDAQNFQRSMIKRR